MTINFPGIYKISSEDYHADSMKRFLKRHQGIDGCWVWPLWKDKDGYGRTQVNGKTAIAHRVAYSLTNGHIPDGLCVLHHCDNRSCCNPEHLFLGTPKDNYDDAYRKGRVSVGERNGISKLTKEKVLSIRKDIRKQVVIAEEYGILQTTVSEIKNKHLWRHLND